MELFSIRIQRTFQLVSTPFVLLGYAMIYVIGVLIPLLRYVVSMMDYFTRTRV